MTTNFWLDTRLSDILGKEIKYRNKATGRVKKGIVELVGIDFCRVVDRRSVVSTVRVEDIVEDVL